MKPALLIGLVVLLAGCSVSVPATPPVEEEEDECWLTDFKRVPNGFQICKYTETGAVIYCYEDYDVEKYCSHKKIPISEKP